MEWVLGVGGRMLPGGWARVAGDAEPVVDLQRLALLLGASLESDGPTLRVRRHEYAFTWLPGQPWITAGSQRYPFFSTTPPLEIPSEFSHPIPLAPVLAALNISWEMIRGERLIRVARPDRHLVSRRVRFRLPAMLADSPEADMLDRLSGWLRLHGVDTSVERTETTGGEEGRHLTGRDGSVAYGASEQAGESGRSVAEVGEERRGQPAPASTPLATIALIRRECGTANPFGILHAGDWAGWWLATHMQRELFWELGLEGSAASAATARPGNVCSTERPVVFLHVDWTALRQRAEKCFSRLAAEEAVAAALFRALRSVARHIAGRGGISHVPS